MWRTNLLSSFLQPMMYLAGLGIGVGALVDRNVGADSAGTSVVGDSYVAFVAPGLLVTTAMMLSAMESMWPVLAGLKWQRRYHGIAATPLDATDIVLGHALWIVARCLVACGAVAGALAVFPDTRSWGLPLAVAAAILTGLAFAMPIAAFAMGTDADRPFPAIHRFVIIPLFLFGGAFYPLSELPRWVQLLAQVAPLHHGVELARAATTASDLTPLAVVWHVGYLLAFFVVGVAAALPRLRSRLYP